MARDLLDGVEFMSTLDMNSGYYQFVMAAADQCKTAFLTKYALVEALVCAPVLAYPNSQDTFILDTVYLSLLEWLWL